MSKRNPKCEEFLRTVRSALDNDKKLTLLEYAEQMGVKRWNAYELLKTAVNGDENLYRSYLSHPENQYHGKRTRKSSKKIISKEYNYSEFIEFIDNEIEKIMKVVNST